MNRLILYLILLASLQSLLELSTCADETIASDGTPTTEAEQSGMSDETAIDPHLLESVWHPVTGLHSKGVRPEEAKAYYAILAQARALNLKQLKSAAKNFLDERIDNFRNDLKIQYREKLEAAERFRTSNPQKYKDLRLYAREYYDFHNRKCAKFKQNPDEFHSFVDLHKNSEAYHGRLVTFRGHIRRLVSFQPGKNSEGIEKLYEAWLYTDDSQRNPAVIVCTSIPEGMMQAFKESEILDHVSVTGYFFKNYAYKSQRRPEEDRGEMLFAPMILAQKLEWKPLEGAPTTPRPTGVILYSFVCAITLIAIAILWYVARKDRLFRKNRLQSATDSIPPSLDNLVVSADQEPNFDDLNDSSVNESDRPD